MGFLEELAARRRFGMKPGLDTIRAVCAALGNPQKKFKAIHVAGTNGKGAVCAILDAALRADGLRVGRYTSPHLVRLNERFFLNGAPVDDATLERISAEVSRMEGQRSKVKGQGEGQEEGQRSKVKGQGEGQEEGQRSKVKGQGEGQGERSRSTADEKFHCLTSDLGPQTSSLTSSLTFFEALTAVAFELYAEADVDLAILECGLGGRLDATNVCDPALCVITKIGLDHCDWLGDTVEKIAAEKAGIIKKGVPVVLGKNEASVRAVIEARAKDVGAPFHYAPDLADESEIPADFSLAGSFNRENAVTALASLKVGGEGLTFSANFQGQGQRSRSKVKLPSLVVWPGRFQRIGNFIVDGAHNPPAAKALRDALLSTSTSTSTFNLIAGFCGDKDVDEVLSILSPLVKKGYAVKTNNPRSLSAEETAARMRKAGIDAIPCASLRDAMISVKSTVQPSSFNLRPSTLVCGSLFLAGEALVELGASPWPTGRFDPDEALKPF